jgi:hypothetical protein
MDWFMQLIALKFLLVNAACPSFAISDRMQCNPKRSILDSIAELHGCKIEGFIKFCKALALGKGLSFRIPIFS